MLRSVFIVFIAGWIAWFALDKPRPGPGSFPRASDRLLDNFQLAFDMLRAGQWEYAYTFIWNAHYLVLSLLAGALLAMLIGSVSDYLGRRRMRRLILPKRKEIPQQENKSAAPESPSTPAQSE
ncbi:MAG: hypothetical protein OEU91_02580 [Gammaproteobacteria bacterium]|nr:hypothetical protein [Gammaproteobacteria bacterium]